jgi:hypothetical protein
VIAVYSSVIFPLQVYDCFDHALAEEIAAGAVEWLYRLLERDDVKIVVVETECAMLHQKALFEGVRLSYWEPMWLDDIFVQGLKGVESDKMSSQYDRVFVVRYITLVNLSLRNGGCQYVCCNYVGDAFKLKRRLEICT